MQKFQFYSLSRPIQERFIDSTWGNALPKPLLRQPPAHNPRAVGLLVAAGLLCALCAGFARSGFGELDHRWALNPPWAILVYGGLLCACSATLTGAIRLWARDAHVPFRRGRYIFPVGVIDAQSAAIELYPLRDIKELSLEGNCLRMRFSDGAAFEFRCADPELCSEIKATLLDTQRRFSVPPAEMSNRDQALLNPFVNTGYRNPFSPHESMHPPQHLWNKRWFLLAMAIGATAGVGLWKLRNVCSAERLYAHARSVNTTRAYAAYLARGGTRSDVRELLMPRAELRDAQATGSVGAVECYRDGHPNSRILGEIEAALRAALLAELNGARQSGAPSALRDFRKNDRYTSLIRTEIDAAQRERYSSVLTRFQSLSKSLPELIAFFERLLPYTEQHGPKVEIRFRRRIPASVQKADAQIQKSPYFSGALVLPAQYFDAKHFLPREAKAGATIRDRLAEAFPADILSFELAPALDDDGSSVPAVTTPTLLITHRTEMSAPYTSHKPQGVFVGIGLLFKVELLMPGDSAPRRFESSTWSPPDFKKLEQEGWGAAELYESMAQEGFSQFLNKYLGALFRAPT